MFKKKLILGLAALAVVAVTAVDATAQDPSTRFGRWKMDSDAPAPSVNIMTYGSWGDGGMSITVASTTPAAR